MFSLFRTATILLGLLTIVTGVIYPVAVTMIAQVAFPHSANGSLIQKPETSSGPELRGNSRDGRSGSESQHVWVGSELVGQSFSDPKYFWGRPSATGPMAYHGLGGSGSNQAPTNPALVDAVKARIAKLRAEDPDNEASIPIDLVTASGSGLDPHVTEAAALYQAGRIARVRKIDAETVSKLILSHTERPTAGVLGQARVNVLKLNLTLDRLATKTTDPTDSEGNDLKRLP